jgi:predicted acylesterase/phospholipase RssA
VQREPIDLVFSGSGTLLPCHIGAWAALRQENKVFRVAGTSGGGIVAAAVAFGWTPDRALKLAKEFLAGGLLDSSWWFFDRWGVHKWDRIRDMLHKQLPHKMREACLNLRVMVVDLETQRPVEINSDTHPDLLVADVLAATSAIPAFAKARKIPGLEGLFVDGGTSTNFAMGTFDDVPYRRTIGVRLVGTPKRRQIKSTADWAGAVVGAMHDAANKSYVSRKRWADVIEVHSAGDGMDFTLDEAQVQALYDEGYQAASEWLRRDKEPQP